MPNHSSDKHEWFEKSVKREGKYTDYYVWADAKIVNGERQPPNNWVRNHGRVLKKDCVAFAGEVTIFYLDIPGVTLPIFGMGVERGARPVLPAPVRPRAARPQLPQRRRRPRNEGTQKREAKELYPTRLISDCFKEVQLKSQNNFLEIVLKLLPRPYN